MSRDKPFTFRPMLGATCKDVAELQLPLIATPKLDGIRCLIHPTLGPVTRLLKPIRNRHVRSLLAQLPAFDGELISGDPLATNVWNVTDSAIMSEDGEPEFTYWVFDLLPLQPNAAGLWLTPYYARITTLKHMVEKLRFQHKWLRYLQHSPVRDLPQLEALEKAYTQNGYEGVMLRAARAPYKCGRSTMKEQGLVKLKRMEHAEAIIIDFVEKKTNLNEAKRNVLGYTERSGHKANKKGADTLGALVCRWVKQPKAKLAKKAEDVFFGDGDDTFKVGTGFDDAMRASIWKNQSKWKGATIRLKFQGLTPDGAPRFPVFEGRRRD